MVDSDERAESPNTEHTGKKKKIFHSLGRVLRRKNKEKSKSLTDLTRPFYDTLKKQGSIESQISVDSSVQGANSVSEDNFDIDGLNDNDALNGNGSSVCSDQTDDVGEEDVVENESQGSQDVDDDEDDEEEEDEDDDDESTKLDENGNVTESRSLFQTFEPGTTAASIWRSGVCSFFSVEGKIVSGEGLIARDSSGTSDPYVKVKLRQRCVYKSKIVYRSLSPEWNESFQLAVDDVNTDLGFKVYDFDRLSHDDYMGEAQVSLGTLEINKEIELKLPLINKEGLQEDFGRIIVVLSIIPKTPNEQIELSQLLNSAKRATKHNSKSQIWDSLLSVILVDGKNLKTTDGSIPCDPFVRFKLNQDKYKSKICKQTLNPVWHEQFDMKMFVGGGPMPLLEVTLWDRATGRDEFMGRSSLELSSLTPEKSHYCELLLEDQLGTISLHVSITAQSEPGAPSNLESYVDDPDVIKDIERSFSLTKTAHSLKEVGWLQIKLHRAAGLAVADLGGASDPFAVLEMGNQRLVTPTVYKNLNPRWDKVYEMTINDIHDVLEITVFDEDRRGAPEFLGRVKIPLLSITSWEKRLYQLKDKRLQAAAKGHLIITFGIIYNPVRASIRTFNPKEEKVLCEPPRFRRQLLQQNVDRLQNVIRSILATGEFIQSLFTWQYKLRSAFAFCIYILLVTNFDWFMLPLILFLVLLKNYIVYMLSPYRLNQEEDTGIGDIDDDDDDDGDDKNKKGKAKTFREKLDAISNICTLVQNRMDTVASFGERIKNTFNWTVPFLSYLLMVILLLATIILYAIPLRYLLLAWGVNKFTKKIRKPNGLSNNELLDFLSRIPSDPEVKQRRHLKADVPLG